MRTCVLVTGASGFIGRRTLNSLERCEGVRVVASNRTAGNSSTHACIVLRATDSIEQMRDAVQGVDVIVHIAGRAHRRRNTTRRSLWEDNVEFTLKLTKAAIAEHVSRIVLLSSASIHGSRSCEDRPISPNDAAAPSTLYAESKLEAERVLLEIAAKGAGIETVIVRPPLVYGVGAPGNLALLKSVLKHQLPIPIPKLQNRRSFVSVGNLSDLLVRCALRPAAANQVFLASDGCDISARDFITTVASSIAREPVFVTLPEWMWELQARLPGIAKLSEPLLRSFRLDSSSARTLLGWTPKQDLLTELNDDGGGGR